MILPRIPDDPLPTGYIRARLWTIEDGFGALAGLTVVVPADTPELRFTFPADSVTADGHGEPAGDVSVNFAANGVTDYDGALIYTPGGR